MSYVVETTDKPTAIDRVNELIKCQAELSGNGGVKFQITKWKPIVEVGCVVRVEIEALILKDGKPYVPGQS